MAGQHADEWGLELVSRCAGKIEDEIGINIFHRNAAHINLSFRPVVRGGVNIPAKIAKA